MDVWREPFHLLAPTKTLEAVVKAKKRENVARPWRRHAVLLGAIVAFGLAAGVELLGRARPDFAVGRGAFTGNSLFRLGIVLGALWLAMPTLGRPLQWLPPIFATVLLVAVGVMVIQPKFILIMLPVLIGALSLSWVWRLLRLGKGNR